MAEGTLYFQGIYDLDKDGVQESLLLNSGQQSASWVELVDNKVDQVIWQYSLPYKGQFADAELLDIDGDGLLDLVAITKLSPSTDTKDWLYIFRGTGNNFEAIPSTLNYTSLDLGKVRPLNISKISKTNNQLAVAFGTPVRQAIIFNLSLSDEKITLKNKKMLSAPIIENGYGHLFASGFISNGVSYLAIISPEGNKIKTAVFDMDSNGLLLKSDLLLVGDAKQLIGAGIQPFKTMQATSDGLVVPYGTDDVFLLQVKGEELKLKKTDMTGQAIPQIVEYQHGEVQKKVIKKTSDNSMIPPVPMPIRNERMNFKELTSLPYDYKEVQFKKKRPTLPRNKDLDVLTPTLGDYLASIEAKEAQLKETDIERTGVPKATQEMHSERWADEAGFEQVNLGEYISEMDDASKTPVVPALDDGVVTFTNTVHEVIAFKPVAQGISQFEPVEGEIDLYYVLAITPAVSESKDRYVFDGEAPFGVSVNQIPQIGEPTHFQHGISANLNGLRRGETFDFAYSLRNAQTDSVTTLIMVHDMQTNVVFMSILPERDSLSQSYQPEAFDPTLFEFPDYFFDGFPTSLGMDFTDKLIRFSFAGNSDTTIHKGIYLSSTTPSVPAQSLAVFMDDGKLQAIRGEIIVRENGSKKVTTEFDLDGYVEPSVMFSRLIEEYFPDSLKVQLLQDGSLREPLFGPKDKLPKIVREQRLPDVQFDQGNPEIPVAPIQSLVPDAESSITEETTIKEKQYTPEAVDPTVVVPKIKSVIDDSLKLEKVKELPINADKEDNDPTESLPPIPEESQPESSVPDPKNSNEY
tara:strand:- start:4107 stop:6518 length:2412 start_codon:yes stop_codon:yes gene_type:complete